MGDWFSQVVVGIVIGVLLFYLGVDVDINIDPDSGSDS